MAGTVLTTPEGRRPVKVSQSVMVVVVAVAVVVFMMGVSESGGERAVIACVRFP